VHTAASGHLPLAPLLPLQQRLLLLPLLLPLLLCLLLTFLLLLLLLLLLEVVCCWQCAG
jgi:hypothetical protein